MMMTLTNEQRELYSSRDRELIEKREFYWSQAEQYPMLEDVIRGRAKLSDRALELDNGFWKTLPRTVMILRYGGFLKKFTLPYVGKLMPFVEMVSDLSGERTAQNLGYEQQLMSLLCDIIDPYSRKTRERLEHFFLSVVGSAVLLDKSIHRHFLDVLVQEKPELFKEEYSRMNADDREYAEYTLSRMLGAGILKDMDEIELERIIREARELKQSENDGTE